MVHTYPDLIALFASPDLIATVERGELWTDGHAERRAVLGPVQCRF